MKELKIRKITLTGNVTHNLCFLSRDFDLSFYVKFGFFTGEAGLLFRTADQNHGHALKITKDRITFIANFSPSGTSEYKEQTIKNNLQENQRYNIRVLFVGSELKISVDNRILFSSSVSSSTIGNISIFGNIVGKVNIYQISISSLDKQADMGDAAFVDKFNDINNWEIISGHWQTNSGCLRGTAEKNNIYARLKENIPQFGGVSFYLKNENDLRMNYGSGILLRFSPETQKGVAVHCFPSHGYISLYPDFDLSIYNAKTEICYPGLELKHHMLLKPNCWHYLQIKFTKTQFWTYFDDVLIHQSNNIPYHDGQLLLCVGERNTAQFSDFRLYRSEETI